VRDRLLASLKLGRKGFEVRMKGFEVRMKSGEIVIRTLLTMVLASVFTLGSVVAPSSEGGGGLFGGDVARAHHGSWHYHQHNQDSGSCCVEVWGHSACSQGCNLLVAGIKKSGVWYNTECEGSGDACWNVYSPHKVYSTGTTVVSTRHYYVAGFSHNSNGYNYRDVRYP
jgi:hypothetical protein